MKKFTIYLSVLIGVLFIFCVAFEYTLRLAPNQYKYKYNYMERHAGEIETLVMGHSQAAEGINPAFLGDHAFNLAITSRRIHYDYVLLKQYIGRMKNLKRVIYPYTYNYLYISYEYPLRNLNARKNTHAENYMQCDYEIYMHTGLFTFPAYHIEILYDMTARDKWKKHYLKREDTQLVDSLGFDGKLKEDRVFDWLQSPLAHEYDENDPDYDKAYRQNRKYLYQMAELCREHQVELVLVATPTLPPYYNSRRPDKLKQFYDEAENLKAQYSNVSFKDYVTDGRFENEDFYDCSHLCKEGADKFTRILRQDLEI